MSKKGKFVSDKTSHRLAGTIEGSWTVSFEECNTRSQLVHLGSSKKAEEVAKELNAVLKKHKL